MKNKYFIIILVIVISLTSCEQYYNPGLNIKTVQEDTINIPEIDALLKYINNSGDYINSQNVPNIIEAIDIYDNLESNYIIDIRTHEEYVDGHINGAINVKPSEIIDFLDKNVSPSEYKRLVITCHTGQSSAYVVGILRLMGYNNAFSLKYGMGAWNKSLDKWSENISNKFANNLDTVVYKKEKSTNYPQIKTGKQCGAEILEARARTLLNTPFSNLKISAERAFSDTSFYIINYFPIEKYKKGHMPNSAQYTPKEDLKTSTFLNTLPTNKKILVYCFTGQNSAFVVAYLRLLGYNAFTLGFGANSFMNSTLVSREGWSGFVAKDALNDFPLIKGESPTDKQINVGTKQEVKPTAKKIVKKEKKSVSGGCG